MNSKIIKRCGNIQKRSIILYGEYEEIKYVINRYNELLNIKIVATDYKDDVKKQPYDSWGINCVLFEDVQYDEELIIICDKKKFGVHKRYLWHRGLEEYKDYISAELIDSLLYQKKLFLFMGTHLIRQVYQLLEESKHISEKYSIVYYSEKELKEAYMNRFQEYMHMARCCDVYVRSSCQEKQYYLKILNSAQLSKDCKIITISDYGFGGYFPQIINDRDVISNYLLRGRERLDMSYETLALSRVDKEMEELCNEGILVADIVKKLMNKSYFEKTYILNYFRDEIQRIKLLEIDDDIRLGNFIELHAKECLCRNLNEWNEPVVTYVAKELCHILGLSDDLPMDQEEREKMIEEGSGSELLIYPCVAAALDLNETIQNKKYKVVTYYDVKYMSTEEYIQYLATYLCKAIDLLRYTGMDQTLLEEE